MYEKPIINIAYKSENWKPFPVDDRLRCQACNGIYWRLWEDAAQCMGCRSYTGIVIDGPTGTFRDVKWAAFSLLTDTRLRDPVSGKSEWIVFKDKIRSRSNKQELIVSPTIQGTWLMVAKTEIPSKAMNSKEAIEVFKKSTAIKNRKKDPSTSI